MNIFQPPYVYTKRKRNVLGEVVLWIVGGTLLVLSFGAILGLLGLIFTAFVMSVWSYWR